MHHREPYSVLCGDLIGKGIQSRGDICIADSLWCTAKLTQYCKATILQWLFFKKIIVQRFSWLNITASLPVRFLRLAGDSAPLKVAENWEEKDFAKRKKIKSYWKYVTVIFIIFQQMICSSARLFSSKFHKNQ